jgi:inosine-uridine nucleoside N-ribohydrolase
VNGALVIDTDGGVDDVLACLTAEHSHPRTLVTTVGGNVSAAQAAQNIAQFTALPVAVGVDPPDRVPGYRHGTDGVNGCSDGVRRRVDEDAVGVLRGALQDPRTTVAALGPLTNVAAAAGTLAPGDLRARVLALGGIMDCPPGLQDTNVAADVTAARFTASRIPQFTWLGLRDAAERTRTPLTTVAASGAAELARAVAQRTAAAWGTVWGGQDAAFYDVAVVCAALGVTDAAAVRGAVSAALDAVSV